MLVLGKGILWIWEIGDISWSAIDIGDILGTRRHRGRVVRVLDLKSGDPESKSRSDHWLDLFQVVLGSTPRLHLYLANWFASCRLGFLTRYAGFKVECLWASLRAKCTFHYKYGIWIWTRYFGNSWEVGVSRDLYMKWGHFLTHSYHLNNTYGRVKNVYQLWCWPQPFFLH